MKPHTVTIPVADKSGRKRYPRVGAMFENHNSETGEVFYTIRLDYPVGATEFLVFPPREKEADAVAREDAGDAAADAPPEAPDAETTPIAASGAS